MTTVQTKVLMPEKKKKVTLAQVILVTIIMLFVLICVLPIINVASVSLSSKSAILRGDVAFLPVEPTINAYKAMGGGWVDKADALAMGVKQNKP